VCTSLGQSERHTLQPISSDCLCRAAFNNDEAYHPNADKLATPQIQALPEGGDGVVTVTSAVHGTCLSLSQTAPAFTLRPPGGDGTHFRLSPRGLESAAWPGHWLSVDEDGNVRRLLGMTLLPECVILTKLHSTRACGHVG
jgi:hypothetical protein